MPIVASHTVTAERQRIEAEYSRRKREIDTDTYAPWQPAELFMACEKRRLASRMLRDVHAFPDGGADCLEIGFGWLGWLGDLATWGVRQTNMHGVDLNADRVAAARQILPTADLRVCDAAELPWEDRRFNLVIASNVFTSILDDAVRCLVANEITRVLAPGGALLWYDFAVNNPSNPHVRKVDRRELRELFPELSGAVKSITLAPPLARFVAPRSWVLATMLEAIPFLRTHLIGVLIKK